MLARSGGEVLHVRSELPWARRLIARALGRPDADPNGADDRHTDPNLAGALDELDGDQASPGVSLVVEASREGFDRTGMRVLTRGGYTDGRRTLLSDVGGSGFDLLLSVDDELAVRARYRPRQPVRLANLALASRFALLAGQVLVHYPVLWRAGWRGRVPLHASVVATGSGTPLLAGPGGVGKSTVLSAAMAAGAVATADNLCCADERSCFGIAEPLRTDAAGGSGRRTSHGRVDRPFTDRVSMLQPDRLLVLERGPVTEIAEIAPQQAARTLIAGTYSAGELRRYWAFAASLALATGLGPAHPPIEDIANRFAERLPCLRVCVGDGDRVDLAALCARWEREHSG